MHAFFFCLAGERTCPFYVYAEPFAVGISIVLHHQHLLNDLLQGDILLVLHQPLYIFVALRDEFVYVLACEQFIVLAFFPQEVRMDGTRYMVVVHQPHFSNVVHAVIDIQVIAADANKQLVLMPQV